ncbi:MAG TPA: PilZ domain-containing protein [Pyrinomonadaceae bacterium]|nr:PilZ domain-containing protein [Pyrinomonadaceae bacterium]
MSQSSGDGQVTVERREEGRAGVDTALYVLWLAEEEEPSPRAGKITNLSCGGCFIQTKAEVQTSRTVLVRLKLPTGRWLLLQGAVAHAARKVGFGLRFTNLSAEDRGMLCLLEEYYRGEGVIIPTVVSPEEGPLKAKPVKPR